MYTIYLSLDCRYDDNDDDNDIIVRLFINIHTYNTFIYVKRGDGGEGAVRPLYHCSIMYIGRYTSYIYKTG